MLLIVSYISDEVKKCYTPVGAAKIGYGPHENFLHMVKDNRITEVRIYDTETRKHRLYENTEVIKVAARDKIANVLLGAGITDNSTGFRVGKLHMELPSLWDLATGGSTGIPVGDPDKLLNIVGISCDGSCVIGVTLGGDHKFIRIRDIIDTNFGKCNEILSRILIRKSRFKDVVDLTSLLVRMNPSKLEELRLSEIGNRNTVLCVTGNDKMYWSSDGSLCLKDGVRRVNLKELGQVGMYTDFTKLSNIEDFTVQHGRLRIPDRLFFITDRLRHVHLPDELLSVGLSNFSKTGLRKLDLRNCLQLKNIDMISFSQNPILEELYLPDNITTLAKESCSKNPELKILKLPRNLETLYGSCLTGNNKLEKLILPEVKFELVTSSMFISPRWRSENGLKEIVTSRVNLDSAKILANGKDIIKLMD